MTAPLSTGKGLSLARVPGVVGVLALTILPIFSCGPVNVSGHEILMNRAPVEREPGVEPGPLFGAEDQWLQWTYYGSLASAVLGALSTSPASSLVGGGGGLATLGVFLLTIDGRAKKEGGPVKFEAGAYLGLFAFIAMLVRGGTSLRRRGAPGRRDVGDESPAVYD